MTVAKSSRHRLWAIPRGWKIGSLENAPNDCPPARSTMTAARM
jgi:hypothetical protein